MKGYCARENNTLVTCEKQVKTDITKQHKFSQVFIAHYPKQIYVGGKFGICFVKCRKNRKVVYYSDVRRKGCCKKKAII